MISTREELRDASAAFVAQYLAQCGSATAEEGRGTQVVPPGAQRPQPPFESSPGFAPALPTAAKRATFEAVLSKATFDEQQREGASPPNGGRQHSSGAGWLRQFRCDAFAPGCKRGTCRVTGNN